MMMIKGFAYFAALALGAAGLEEETIQQMLEMETAILGPNEVQQLAHYAESVADSLNGSFTTNHSVDSFPWNKECMECTCQAAHVDLEIAFGVVKGMCERHPEGRGGWWHICRWVQKQPEEVKGYIEAKMHALLTGFSYCWGKGVCSLKPAESSDSPLNGMMKSIHQCSSMVDATQEVSTFGVHDERRQAVTDHIRNVLESTQQLHGKSMKRSSKECRHCLKITMRHVVRMAEQKACRLCHEHENCHAVHAVCEFMKAHPHFAKGFIIGMVEPWKFSMGFCIGKGLCTFGNESDDDEADEHSPADASRIFEQRHAPQPPLEWLKNLKADVVPPSEDANVAAIDSLMELVQ